MSDERFREKVQQRREELKKSLAVSDNKSADGEADLQSDLHAIEETLRNGWDKASPLDLAALKARLGEL